MGIKHRFFIQLFFTIIIFTHNIASAEFLEPIEIVVGSWGQSVNEFGIEGDGPYVEFPRVITVNSIGNIFISDKINKLVKIYSENGRLLSVIEPKNLDVKYNWPEIMNCDSKNNIYTSNWDNKLQKYNIKGELLWEKDIVVGSIIIMPHDEILIVGFRPEMEGKEVSVLFSSSGTVLKTYIEKPLELGIVKEKSLGDKNWRVTIEYPDIKYTLTEGLYKKYIRHYCKSDLFAITDNILERFNKEGGVIGNLVIPEDKRKPEDPKLKGFGLPLEVLEQYGEPVVAPTGDIYTWKRTPETYSIIKWVWVDSLDAPYNLDTQSSGSALSLTWEVPAEDADKVKEYEIVRSTDVCGPFDVIGEVKKDTNTYVDKEVKKGETYYYKVRAVKEDGYSGYSNKAVGNL